MKTLLISLMAMMAIFSSTYACVTYNPSKGTYTVDKNGCADQKK